ncbi:Alpha/Beta hydrolase protein [Obelidium mucronatum]|nr:Alpha/Beta hydrolase protein [Obelidium mucronatum]
MLSVGTISGTGEWCGRWLIFEGWHQPPNFQKWLAWSFFSVRCYDDLSHDAESVSELNGYIADMEMMKNLKIQPGRNPDISPVILNYNPIVAKPKPLALYLFIWGLEFCGYLTMSLLGFTRMTPADRPYHIDNDSEASLNYWYYIPRTANNTTAAATATTTTSSDSTADKLPVVFLHGIGCGLFQYVIFIYSILSQTEYSRPVFVLEFPHVSMRLVDHVPSTEQTVSEIESMLDAHGFSKAHIIGHSLGTTVAAWMVKYSKYSASLTLLDPVVFMYLLPSLAFSFILRKPGHNTDTVKANEYLLYWLCGRELYTANAICRHFRWHHNLLWPDTLPKHHHVVVGKQDFLFDGGAVAEYLSEHAVSHKLYDIGHGGFMLRPSINKEIVSTINKMFIAADFDVAQQQQQQQQSNSNTGGVINITTIKNNNNNSSKNNNSKSIESSKIGTTRSTTAANAGLRKSPRKRRA